MEDLTSIFFNRVEIPIVNCPPELEGAEVEYEGFGLQVMGIVEDGKLITEAADVPEDAVIVWGRGRWVISW